MLDFSNQAGSKKAQNIRENNKYKLTHIALWLWRDD